MVPTNLNEESFVSVNIYTAGQETRLSPKTEICDKGQARLTNSTDFHPQIAGIYHR